MKNDSETPNVTQDSMNYYFTVKIPKSEVEEVVQVDAFQPPEVVINDYIRRTLYPSIKRIVKKHKGE